MLPDKICSMYTPIEFFHMTSAKSGGGKVNELLCNEPSCNVLNSALTLK